MSRYALLSVSVKLYTQKFYTSVCIKLTSYYVVHPMPSLSLLFPFALIGMLSKSMGQILRVSAALHVLFNIDGAEELSETISEMVVDTAVDFVEVCCQHAAYITGRGNLDEEVNFMETGEHCKFTMFIIHYIIYCFSGSAIVSPQQLVLRSRMRHLSLPFLENV